MPFDPAVVRARVEQLRTGLPAVDVARFARDVVVIASSSRGGSSIFAEVLRRSPSLLHFRAEINPQLRLFGCAGVDDDSIAVDHPVPSGLGTALGADCGQPTEALADAGAFAVEIAARLAIQWPEWRVPVSEVESDVRATFAALSAEAAWPPGRMVDPQAFYARLFPRFASRFPDFHPAAYDLDRRRLEGWDRPYTPGTLVEEPPFVLPLPWTHATEADLAVRPLIIKTPSNVYRLRWLRRLFPNARVRVLHLTRNAAASINGLYDGWRFNGFHSHDVGGLTIPGYSDAVPGGDRWWKFDRPPGWQAWTAAPLERVCAFQWASAHQAALADAGEDCFRLRFEDVMGPPHRQDAAMGALADWLGVPVREELTRTLATALPLVMATEQPRHRRWFARTDLLGPVCREPSVRETMAALGYPDAMDAWE